MIANILVLASLLFSLIDASFVNTEVTNLFDVTSSYGKLETEIRVRNDGDEPISDYYYALNGFGEIAVLEARTAGDSAAVPQVFPAHEVSDVTELASLINGDAVDLEDIKFFKVSLPLISPGSEFAFAISCASLGAKYPLPRKAHQTEPQMMAFENSRVLYSLYPTEEQSTRIVTFGGRETELIVDPEDPWDHNKNVVVYGPYQDVEPLSNVPFKVQFESPVPVVTVNSLDRKIWVSHWGESVSFDETYETTNEGTELSEPFSRATYMLRQVGLSLGTAAIRVLEFSLPPHSRDVYYTDQVGNVSTSNYNPPTGTLQVRPRFPVFGGWHYNFTVGWSVPFADNVHQVGTDQYVLKVPIIEGPRDVSYKDTKVSVILPEGATGIKVRPLPAYERVDNKTFSYLDTTGRPTVNLRFANLIDVHRVGDIYISYELKNSAVFTKPLAITSFFTVVFAVIIGLSKVDLSISKKK